MTSSSMPSPRIWVVTDDPTFVRMARRICVASNAEMTHHADVDRAMTSLALSGPPQGILLHDTGGRALGVRRQFALREVRPDVPLVLALSSTKHADAYVLLQAHFRALTTLAWPGDDAQWFWTVRSLLRPQPPTELRRRQRLMALDVDVSLPAELAPQFASLRVLQDATTWHREQVHTHLAPHDETVVDAAKDLLTIASSSEEAVSAES